jgi:intracellular septation protein
VNEHGRKWLRYAVDFSTPLSFIIVYFAFGRDFMKATAVSIVVAVIAIAVGLIIERRIAWLPLFIGVMSALFAGLTLFFHQKWILQNRPTFVNIFIGALLLGGLAMKKNPIKAVLGSSLELPDEAWRKLGFRYGLWSLFLGVLNFLVWKTQSEATWVTFDTIGLRILSALFGMSQVPLLMKYMSADEVAHEAPPPPPVD